MKFVNLHHHSTFSFGDGFGTPAQHVARAAELGYEALAFTEHGNVSSHWQLEKEALQAGIKPIFGLEAYTGAVDEENKQQFKFHLTILAMNEEGYRGLNRVVTQSWRDFYYDPTVSGTSLGENREGLAILSGCSGSLLACSLLGGKGIPDPGDGYDWYEARDIIERFKDCFDNYFLEVQPFHELERTCKLNTAYEKLSTRLGVPLVVTCDVHYPRMEDAEMQAVLHAAHRGKNSVEEQMRSWNYEVPLTLPETEQELKERLSRTGISKGAVNEAVANARVIADMCNVTLPKAARLRYPIIEEDMKPWQT
jgi:DNA polymerase III subunit alpha